MLMEKCSNERSAGSTLLPSWSTTSSTDFSGISGVGMVSDYAAIFNVFLSMILVRYCHVVPLLQRMCLSSAHTRASTPASLGDIVLLLVCSTQFQCRFKCLFYHCNIFILKVNIQGKMSAYSLWGMKYCTAGIS